MEIGGEQSRRVMILQAAELVRRVSSTVMTLMFAL